MFRYLLKKIPSAGGIKDSGISKLGSNSLVRMACSERVGEMGVNGHVRRTIGECTNSKWTGFAKKSCLIMQDCSCQNCLLNLVKSNRSTFISKRTLYTSLNLWKVEDRKQMLASMPKKDEGTSGERAFDMDLFATGKTGMFPDENTPDLLVGGVRFDDLPICHVKVSKNNTIISITEGKGNGFVKLIRSCGMEGFQHTRKGTNIAAQATAISFGTKASALGYKNIRVKIQGLGPGRMSSIKGLQMGGLNIVSITDSTPISFNPPRPRKARRL